MPERKIAPSRLRLEKASEQDLDGLEGSMPTPIKRCRGLESGFVTGSPMASLSQIGFGQRSPEDEFYSRIPPPLPLFEFDKGGERAEPPRNGAKYPMQWPGPKHLHWRPPEPEPCEPVPERLRREMQELDRSRSERQQALLNRIVYDSIETPPGGPKKLPAFGVLPPWYRKQDVRDTTLIFESRFECGNLRRAVQVFPREYDLILKPDTNTKGHTQWFYFSVKGMEVGATYRFCIINLYKNASLYNQGMKPCVYSDVSARKDGIGWQRGAFNICYYSNGIPRPGSSSSYFTLSFCYSPKYSDDTVYFAHCYPYTYTVLRTYLAALERDEERKHRFRRRTLCRTLAGNACDLLTITSPTTDPKALAGRKGIVLSARVHPGESNGSWMMKGMLDYLTGPTLDAQILRDNFVFKVVPMVNPDGVICGNYRCHLGGLDLNRQWARPSRKHQPTIYYLKQMIGQFCKERDVILFCDLHGHSKKKNIFMYGCENTGPLRLRERVFPSILSKNSLAFSLRDCSFKVHKSKLGTGRVSVRREFGLVNAFTMEASFCGPNYGPLINQHFGTFQLEEMGHFFCDTILDYCDPDQQRVIEVMRELEEQYPLPCKAVEQQLTLSAMEQRVIQERRSNLNLPDLFFEPQTPTVASSAEEDLDLSESASASDCMSSSESFDHSFDQGEPDIDMAAESRAFLVAAGHTPESIAKSQPAALSVPHESSFSSMPHSVASPGSPSSPARRGHSDSYDRFNTTGILDLDLSLDDFASTLVVEDGVVQSDDEDSDDEPAEIVEPARKRKRSKKGSKRKTSSLTDTSDLLAATPSKRKKKRSKKSRKKKRVSSASSLPDRRVSSSASQSPSSSRSIRSKRSSSASRGGSAAMVVPKQVEPTFGPVPATIPPRPTPPPALRIKKTALSSIASPQFDQSVSQPSTGRKSGSQSARQSKKDKSKDYFVLPPRVFESDFFFSSTDQWTVAEQPFRRQGSVGSALSTPDEDRSSYI